MKYHEPTPLHVAVFKLSVLAFASALILLILAMSGSGAYMSASHGVEVMQSTMRDVPLEAGFLGELIAFLRNAWDLFWIALRVLLWLAIGAVCVAMILALLAGVGILTWIGKQIGYGFIKLVELVKYAWGTTGGVEPVAVADGKQWTTKEILADLDSRVSVLEKAKGITSE